MKMSPMQELALTHLLEPNRENHPRTPPQAQSVKHEGGNVTPGTCFRVILPGFRAVFSCSLPRSDASLMLSK